MSYTVETNVLAAFTSTSMHLWEKYFENRKIILKWQMLIFSAFYV